MTNIIHISSPLEQKVKELQKKTIKNNIPPKREYPFVIMDDDLRKAREDKLQAECAARLAAAANVLKQNQKKSFLQKLWELI